MPQASTKALLATALLLLAGALLVFNLGGYLAPAEDLVLRPLSAVQSWVSQRYFTARDLFTSPRDVAQLQGRVAELEAENARLRDEIIGLQEQAEEVEILSTLLNYERAHLDSSYMAANVIGLDPSPFVQSITLDAGSD